MKGASQSAATPAAGATPMIAQYLEIKSANADSLLFYRMGDFYEMFFEDAAVASRALGIALMSFTESVAAARSFRNHGDPMPNANQEMFALGMANIGGGFFQACPAGAGTSQTAVNAEAGYHLNKPGEKPSFSSTCRVPGLGNQKLGFFRPEILR